MTHDEVQILYVEDDPADAELTLSAMRRSKMANTIHIARDGVEALDFLFCRGKHANREFVSPKFVLLDLKLPKISGLEVLRAIRADRRTELLPVVVLTSSKEQRDIIDSYKLRVNSYVQKPVDFDAFQQIVQQLGFYWLIVNQPPGAARSEAFSAAAGAGGAYST
jgi:CheY-like chemotaxis protein